MTFAVTVEIRSVEGIADPEGRTIERAVGVLGFGGVKGVRVGKVITFTIDADDLSSARSTVQQLCERLLANTVIERYEITITPVAVAS